MQRARSVDRRSIPRFVRGIHTLAGRRWTIALNYSGIVLGAFTMLFPFLWMVSTSFKPRGEILAFPPTIWPDTFTLQNYQKAFDRLDMVRIYLNTFNVAIIKTAIMVYTGAVLGYVFAKFRFAAREPIFY